jgi:hypothetical protein
MTPPATPAQHPRPGATFDTPPWLKTSGKAACQSKALVVAEGSEEVKEEGPGFAFFVALEFGGELGEIAQALFERGHG